MSLILVVDDDPTTRTMVVTMLKRAGYRTLEAENGERALEVLGRERPDLVVSDMFMPDMDGIELLCTMHDLPDAPPIVAMSGGFDRIDVLPAARNLGAAGALAKPFKAEALYDVLARALPSDRAA